MSPENITLVLERRDTEDTVLERLPGEIVKIALHGFLADALTERCRVETEPRNHLFDHGKISEGLAITPAGRGQADSELDSFLVVSKKAERAQRLERAKRVLRWASERDSGKAGAAQDIPVRVATLRGRLHRTDQSGGVEQSSVDDRTKLPLHLVDARELLRAHERKVGVGRDKIEVEADLSLSVL